MKVVGHQPLLWTCLVAGRTGLSWWSFSRTFSNGPEGLFLIVVLITSFEDSRSLNGLVEERSSINDRGAGRKDPRAPWCHFVRSGRG